MIKGVLSQGVTSQINSNVQVIKNIVNELEFWDEDEDPFSKKP